MSSDGGARRAVLAVVASLLVLAAVAVATLDLTGHLPGGLVADRSASPPSAPARPLDPAHEPAGAVLAPEPASSNPPSPIVLPTRALDAALATLALGGAAGATVVDVASGQVLLDRDAGTARTPASVAKLATAATALSVLGPQFRLRTRVVAGTTAGQVVLVGAGDATLTTRRQADPAAARTASLVGLAEQTAAALAKAGTPGPVSVAVDDSLFTGPAVSPGWPTTYLSAGVVSPVMALSADEGRVRPGTDAREPDPALAAGRSFARLLATHGVTVVPTVGRAVAPTGAQVLAVAPSPTVGAMVQSALQNSDNDLAEALLRDAAIGAGEPASFAGGTALVTETLSTLGVPAQGLVLQDGSGLSRGDRIAPVTLAALLRLAADGTHPALSPLVDGLPVAGFTGTLALRYDTGLSRGGAGVVRAKTGTLTGVSSLAGITSVAGRPVVFAAISDRVPTGATVQARDDLDSFAALLARPGPRG
ncbi:MAG TPA: D-alanyl-D-alanine carboxypeptidase/D-alanyl-D-alanine-endopeptidase [Actinomycetes bacterium]|nr:D-alanyl-D-alanine carboxypeptidase/D-alanyl-D-alanine-endopeptidase [Actinomycetes bacterium]